MEESSSTSKPVSQTDSTSTETDPVPTADTGTKVVSVVSNTTSSSTISIVTNNTVSTSTADSVAVSSPDTAVITFQIQPPPEATTPAGASGGSLAGSTPTANLVTSVPDPFTFQTTRNVNLDGKVTDSNNNPLTNAIIVIKDAEGKLLLQSLTDSNGHVSGTMTVKTADQYAYISIYGNNENTNQVEVPLIITLTDGTTQYIRNINTIGDIKIPISNYTPSIVADADGDGVPDTLDAYPGDATRSTKVRVPATGVNTIAFEDLFPNAGDADLEDYVIQYYNEEDLNAQGQIVEIRGSYQHLARGAGYRHELKLRLPESVSVKYSSAVTKFDGSAVGSGHSTGIAEFTPDVAQLAAGLQILERSDYTLIGQNVGTSTFNPGYISKIKIQFNTPVARSVIGNAPYDLYAYIINTSQEVHLPGKYLLPNCPGSVPSGVSGEGKDCFIDKNGFPWAIIVPGNFRWGKGGTEYSFKVPEKTPYPKFITWYESLGQSDKDWYNYPLNERIYPYSPTEPMPYLISMNQSSSSLMAYLSGNNLAVAISAIALVLVSFVISLFIRKANN